MEAFVPRLYLMPVRDEEAESRRKARSRHARQTRRSTQGVTLTDLKQAPNNDRHTDASCLRTRDSSVETMQTESREPTDHGAAWSPVDEQGNLKSENLPESPNTYLSHSATGPCGPLYSISTNNISTAGDRWWTDENQNPVPEADPLPFVTKHPHRGFPSDVDNSPICPTEHDRLSRYDSSGDSGTDKALGRTSSYTRRETRLSALNRQDQDSPTKDYKKMYAEALHENEQLKSRLQESKQELVKIRSQLEKVTQTQDRISERSSALESEKREKQALEKRVSGMEEELKILTELKSDNQRLKDENGALIRVISKLSK